MDTIHKNISTKSYILISGLIKQNKEFFNVSDASNTLSQNSIGSVRELIRSMIKRGLVLKISDGLYNLIPFEKDVNEYFPNWHLTAKELAKDENYYIGFYSAMDIHGLITQPSLVEQIVTAKQFKPKEKIVKDVKFEFIYFNEKHFFDDFRRACSTRKDLPTWRAPSTNKTLLLVCGSLMNKRISLSKSLGM